MSGLVVSDLHVARRGVPVLHGVDLEVPSGTVTAILGPSGSGKTTLLRAIAGLDGVSAGRIVLAGRDVTQLRPGGRGASMVFEGAPLHPSRDVRGNLALPLEFHGVADDEIGRRVDAEARAFHLGRLLERLPGQLSTGERQATATARSLVRAPGLLLLDEPLAGLDHRTRSAALQQLATVQAGYGVTTLVASNDQRTAAALSQRIVLLRAGRVVQTGTWNELLDEPTTTWVAGFIGDPAMNLVPITVERAGARVALVHGGFRRASWDRHLTVGEPGLTLGVRPEHLEVVAADRADVVGRVRRVELLGPDGVVHLDIGGERDLVARLPRPLPRRGIRLPVHARRLLVFDASGALLGDVR